MTEFDSTEWLDATHAHYDGLMPDAESAELFGWEELSHLPTPVVAAAELLLGVTDADSMAFRINRRGRFSGDDLMAATTPEDCADAVDELISLGFLVDEFSLDGEHSLRLSFAD